MTKPAQTRGSELGNGGSLLPARTSPVAPGWTSFSTVSMVPMYGALALKVCIGSSDMSLANERQEGAERKKRRGEGLKGDKGEEEHKKTRIEMRRRNRATVNLGRQFCGNFHYPSHSRLQPRFAVSPPPYLPAFLLVSSTSKQTTRGLSFPVFKGSPTRKHHQPACAITILQNPRNFRYSA